MAAKIFYIILVVMLTLGSGRVDAECSLNPDGKNKCKPALMKLYKPILKQWEQDSEEEDSVLNATFWPKNPSCLQLRTSYLDCPYIGDIAIDVIELPGVQVLYRTYAVTISACTGVSGASCHLYHHVYLIVDGIDADDEREIYLCSDSSCP